MNLIYGVCALIGLACFCVSVSFLVSLIKLNVFKREKEKPYEKFSDISKWFNDYPIRFILIGIAVILFTLWSNAWFKELIGYDNIETKPSGTYCYYVEITGNKKYTLPAKVNVDVYSDEVAEGKSQTYHDYYIEKVYWSNGGYLYFGDNDERMEVNDSITLYDQDENEWEVKLLNKSAYCSDFKNTSSLDDPINIILGLILLASEIFVWVYCIVYEKRTNK